MFLGAALYTSVGHAGASAYIALMALFGLRPPSCAPRRSRSISWSRASRRFATCARACFAGARFGRSCLGRGAVRFPWRRDPVARRVLPAAGRRDPAPERRAPLVAARAANQSRAARPADMGWHSLRRRHRLPVRPHRHGRRHLPVADLAVSRMVRHAHRVWRRGRVHPLQFDCGPARQRRHREGAAADLWLYAIAVTLGAIVGTTFGIRWQPPMILKALGCVLIIAGLKLIGV